MAAALFIKCPLCAWSVSSVPAASEPALEEVRRQATAHLQERHGLAEADAALTARALAWKPAPLAPPRRLG